MLPFYASCHCHFMIQGTTTLEVAQRFEEASRLEPLQGVTFSGGEPMQQAEALLELMREIRQDGACGEPRDVHRLHGKRAGSRAVCDAPEVQLWSRSATLWRTVRGLLDFAVMGRYDQTQPSMEPLRTSRNQRLVLFSSRYQEGDFGPQLVEISIEESGKSVLTGFPVLGVPA